MSGGGGQTSTTTTQSGLPAWAQQPYKVGSAQWLAAQYGLPNIEALYAGTPLLNVPGLTSGQLADIAGFQNLSAISPYQSQAGGMYGNAASLYSGLPALGAAINPNEALASSIYGNFAPGAGGFTPALNAAQSEFQSLQLPQIQNMAANMGQANSGAALEAASMGEKAALVPLLSQQMQDEIAAAGGLASLGGQQASRALSAAEAAAGGLSSTAGGLANLGGATFNQKITQLTDALQAQGLPYDVAQQQAQAYYQQQQQRQQLAQSVQMGPFSQLPSIFGTGNTVSTIGSAPKF